jgi:hypothetical protein
MNTLKYFWILFKIRWEINKNVLIQRYANSAGSWSRAMPQSAEPW